MPTESRTSMISSHAKEISSKKQPVETNNALPPTIRRKIHSLEYLIFSIADSEANEEQTQSSGLVNQSPVPPKTEYSSIIWAIL